MRIDKLTSRLQTALADAQSLAVGKDHNFIEPVHLMQALLDEGLLSSSADRLRRLAYLWQSARDYERALAAWERVARSGNSTDRLQLAWLQYFF